MLLHCRAAVASLSKPSRRHCILSQLVVLRGVGEKAFCAGGDIKALHDNGINPEQRNAAYSFFRCARAFLCAHAAVQEDRAGSHKSGHLVRLDFCAERNMR